MAGMIQAPASLGAGWLSKNAGGTSPVTGSGKMTRRQMFNRAALLFIFLFLFIPSSLRLNVGNDYAGYVQTMHLIVSNAYVPTEIGFNLLVRILYGLSGFENFLLVFAVLAFATIFIFMLAIEKESENYWFTFFLFMAFGYYFQSFSSVRYYFAVAIALVSIPFVMQKKWLEFVLLILLAAAFHKSVLVVLPLYFLASLKWKKWALAVLALFCTTFFFWQDFYLRVMVFLYPTYRDTAFLAGGISVINIIRCGGVLAFSLLYYRQAIYENARNQFYFFCNLGAFIIYVCCSFIPEVSRIGYYLTVTHIFFLPAIASRIENKKQRYFFTALIIVAGVFYLMMYLEKAKQDGIGLFPYQTFLFHELPLKLIPES
jgi:hypothetical protein